MYPYAELNLIIFASAYPYAELNLIIFASAYPYAKLNLIIFASAYVDYLLLPRSLMISSIFSFAQAMRPSI